MRYCSPRWRYSGAFGFGSGGPAAAPRPPCAGACMAETAATPPMSMASVKTRRLRTEHPRGGILLRRKRRGAENGDHTEKRGNEGRTEGLPVVPTLRVILLRFLRPLRSRQALQCSPMKAAFILLV